MATAEALLITCSICGHQYDPAQHPSCATCPLHEGCSMSCCPNCGTSNINPAGSRLATLLTRLFGGKNAASTLPAHHSAD